MGKKIVKKVCSKNFTGQPSNDPKHPDFRPQIFQNRDTDLEKLQDDLNTWTETRATVPPVIEVTAQGEKLLQVRRLLAMRSAYSKNSEYDQETPQSQYPDKPMAPLGRATKQSRDTRKTN